MDGGFSGMAPTFGRAKESNLTRLRGSLLDFLKRPLTVSCSPVVATSIQGRIASGWDRLTFEVFDTPQPGTFRQRLKALKSLSLPDHVRVVEHSKVSSTQELVELADAVCDAGGEGVVARDPRAPYQAGRSEKALRWVPQNPRVNRRSA